MKTLAYIVSALAIVGNTLSQPDNNRFKAYEAGDPVTIANKVPTSADIVDYIFLGGDPKLLDAIGRGPESLLGFTFPLVYSRPVALFDGDYIIAIFDSPVTVSPGENPRVIILFEANGNIVSWDTFHRNGTFLAAAIVQSHGDRETHLITMNQTTRFEGELNFERYRLSANKIAKIGEGPDPSSLKHAEQGAAANP